MDVVLPLPDVCRTQHGKTFCVGRHHPVLDSVVHHLDKVAAAVRAAMQVALFRRAIDFFASGSAWNIAHTRRKRGEDRIKVLYNIFFSADHHAVTALQSPNSATGAHIHVVDLFLPKFPGALYVVNVVGISAINQNVTGFEMRQQVGDGLVHYSRRDHQPDRARLFQLLYKILK